MIADTRRRQDRQGRANREPDRAASHAARDADRARPQQDRPRHGSADTPATRGMIDKVAHLVRDGRTGSEDGHEDCHETQRNRRQCRRAARSACASAAASAPAWARPAAAAARARPRVPACASRASKAARCRCIGACPSAASATPRSRCKLNEINLGKVQAAIDAGKLDAAATVDVAAMVKAGLMRRAKDGVRLLGAGELKSKVARRCSAPRNRRSRRSKRPAARWKSSRAQEAANRAARTSAWR